ncbi:unnamed protein product [Rhizoctonia solani]|uniref:Protein kinase domain-containing protein n=1 Tax=Rhizoctonia solani TaxID=456999 RepID=A0A8H3BMS0_9AGAM|nr:unnamed protein product [Rhizoctonia solani]
MSTALPPAGNVSRLLTKFGSSTATSRPSSRPPFGASSANSEPNMHAAASSRAGSGDGSAMNGIDIGSYDGGFEQENESRGQPVSGEAAMDLALDSSISNIYNGFQIPSHISSDAADLIRKLLQHDPERRLPLTQVATHPWVLRYKRKSDAMQLD